jgi:hypothetical protein
MFRPKRWKFEKSMKTENTPKCGTECHKSQPHPWKDTALCDMGDILWF